MKTGQLLKRLVVLCCLGLVPSIPAGQNAPAGELVKLADGIYAQVVSPDGNAVSNSGIVVLEHFVIVFDTHFTPEAGQVLLARIQSVTPKPVRFVVDSHFHSDHTHGNQSFPNSPNIVGSTNTRRDMLGSDLPSLNRALSAAREQMERARKEIALEPDTKAQEKMRRDSTNRQSLVDTLSRLKILPPVMTVDDTLSILDGPREIRLISLGTGHTDGDLVLFVPSEKVVFTGDLFFNAAIPNAQDATLLDWMKALDQLLDLDADRFVPGHGPVGTRVDVKQFLAYFEELKKLVEAALDRGDTIEQVLETPVPDQYSSFRFQNFYKQNLEKMYKELKDLKARESPVPKPPEIKSAADRFQR